MRTYIKKKNKSLKKSKKQKMLYYLLHFNNGINPIIIKNNTLFLHKCVNRDDSIFFDSNNKFNMKKLNKFIKIKNYVNKEDLYMNPQHIFKIRNIKKVFIGHDTNPENVYIKNKKFGVGNTILVFDGKDYIMISNCKVEKIKKTDIKGTPKCLISPIGNNDVPYPILFTESHIYSFCDRIDEFTLPKDKITTRTIDLLCKIKNPHQILKKELPDINRFLSKYNTCEESTVSLKTKLLLEFYK